MANNPFINAMGGNSPLGNMPNPLGNVAQMMQSFNKFASAFKGDPKEKVQELLRSGAMSQDQLNQLQEMARQFQQYMPK